MDTSTGEVHIYPYTGTNEELIDSIEEFIDEKGHNRSDCDYMFGENIKIIDHTK